MKTWNDMKQEVLTINQELGWWDKPVSFGTAMALLHSEVSEALQAWRDHGVEDRTPTGLTPATEKAYAALRMPVPAPMRALPKPEGVGSEFADIMIRLLDDDARYSLFLDNFWDHPATFGIAIHDAEDFADNMDVIHRLIVKAELAYEDGDEGLLSARGFFGDVIIFLLQLSRLYGIDLCAEYERKKDFNKTRPYRHGNRRV